MEDASKATFKDQNATFGSVDVKNVKQKMKVAVSYQGFLYQTLKKVLEFLNRGAVHEKEQNFVETFCAIAYFRVPEFRNKLLECLSLPKDKEFNTTEWRGSEWLFVPECDDSKKNMQIVSFFDWDKNFYVYLNVIKLFLNWNHLKNVNFSLSGNT